MSPPLNAVRTWVFDMDDTLYAPELGLWPRVSARITAYVMRALDLDLPAAEAKRRDWAARHGTALAGLMAEHDVDPAPFLEDVHAIDLSDVAPDARLAAAMAALPGRRIVHTNGSRAHAERLTAALGLSDVVHACYGVDDAGYAVKPHRAAFQAVAATDGFDPSSAAMVEDRQINLREPATLGMATIWRPVDPAEPRQPHVQHVATDLAAFLEGAVA